MSVHPDNSAVLARFSMLMDELLRSGFQRAKFEPWEIDLLLDIECCKLSDAAKRRALHGYESAVQEEMEQGAQKPMRFSAYLKRQEAMMPSRRPAGRPAGAKSKILAN